MYINNIQGFQYAQTLSIPNNNQQNFLTTGKVTTCEEFTQFCSEKKFSFSLIHNKIGNEKLCKNCNKIYKLVLEEENNEKNKPRVPRKKRVKVEPEITQDMIEKVKSCLNKCYLHEATILLGMESRLISRIYKKLGYKSWPRPKERKNNQSFKKDDNLLSSNKYFNSKNSIKKPNKTDTLNKVNNLSVNSLSQKEWNEINFSKKGNLPNNTIESFLQEDPKKDNNDLFKIHCQSFLSGNLEQMPELDPDLLSLESDSDFLSPEELFKLN